MGIYIHGKLPMKRIWTFFVFLALGLMVLCIHLGTLPLWGSEGRWAVISRYMFRTSDIFNPMLGILPYWDKPLASYWQVLPFAYMLGYVNELTIRIPSVVWGISLVFMTYDLAKKWFGTKTAFFSAGILMTTYGFVFWARNAQVEMTNAAFIMFGIWYFIRHEEDKTHGWIYVLGVIMAIGSNMKGLTAYAVPIFCILILSGFKRDWSWLPSLKTLILAGLLSLSVFLVIPILGSVHSSSLQPILMVWHENITRFFKPFDHRGPFYIYLYTIFEIAAPWSVLLPIAIWYYPLRKQLKGSKMLDTMILAASILIFFSLSGSRRSYYILPILPFTSIIEADLLKRFAESALPRPESLAVKLAGLFIGIVCMIPVTSYLLKIRPDVYNLDAFTPYMLAIGLAGLIMWMGSLKKDAHIMVLSILMVWLVMVTGVVPWIANRPNNRRELVARIKALNKPVAFLYNDDAKIIFYLDKGYRIFSDIKDARLWSQKSGGILITFFKVDQDSWRCVVKASSWKALVARTIKKKGKTTFETNS